MSGADPGFQVRGGALKKIAPSGGRREHFWGISCEKSQFYAKKSYFSPILGGGARAGCAPPKSAPDNHTQNSSGPKNRATHTLKRTSVKKNN